MDKKIKFVKYSENLCFKCLKEKENIHSYRLAYRGYGSLFDSFNSIIQLCDECNCLELNLWTNETPTMNDYCEEYQHEEKIFDFIDTLPVQGRELFDNQCSDGACAHYINSQDWIDIELGIAPDSVYKENGLYSPSERTAYEERFPTCENVYLKTYKDGSASCQCKFGAHGEKDGSCGPNISDKCYTCNHYKKKGFNYLLKEEKELTIDSSKLKKIEMYQWTCECCGEIVYSHTYLESFSCPKCLQYYEYIE